MTTTTTATGEYVNRVHAVTGTGTYTGVPANGHGTYTGVPAAGHGTYTGVPAAGHGTYVSGVAPASHVGRSVESSRQRPPVRTTTGSVHVRATRRAHH